MHPRRAVVKVGGSLFDLEDLGPRLVAWLQHESHDQILLVPGGGAATNAIRALDQTHRLGEERAHWLALRAMTLNAWFLADVLPEFDVLSEFPPPLTGRGNWIVDAYAFARADDRHEDAIPHCWDVTSDTLAARIASVLEADELVLLKSRTMPAGTSWKEAVHTNLVDRFFAKYVARGRIHARIVNFRVDSSIYQSPQPPSSAE